MHGINGQYSEAQLCQKEVSQRLLNIEDKTRSNPLKWNGQFSPQLVEVLLGQYSSADDVVFDPFLGSGTTLLEAGLFNLSAVGVEINPAAVSLSKIYELINLTEDDRKKTIKMFEQFVMQNTPISGELFLGELGRNVDSDYKKLLEAFYVSCDISKSVDERKIKKNFISFVKLVNDLPYSEKKIQVFRQDSRKTRLDENSIDLVITSPPYINVFNYHQQYRTTVESLGWDVLSHAKSEIGSNRKHRGNRFLTVIQYCLDIALVFEELKRVCKDSSRIIFVVGRESNVRGIPFYNAEILSEIACEAIGMKLIKRQERVFMNRFGQDIYEDILHFEINGMKERDIVSKARGVAKKVLSQSIDKSSLDVREDIGNAINSVEKVSPSPFCD